MNLRRKMLGGGVALGVGQFACQGLAFARNVIVARVVSPADFGIAATLIVTVSLMEMISDLGKGTLVVQSEEGDDPQFIATVHLVSAVRGFLNAAALLLLAWPAAMLFSMPQAVWAFQALALYPVFKTLAHFDTFRFQRSMRFVPATLPDIGSQLITTLIAWPLAIWLRNYSALVWLILIQIGTSAIISHLVAERPYRWHWDRAFARRIFSFGWPLLITGSLMFCIYQADRMIIGAASHLSHAANYTMVDLGLYSLAFTLTLVPTSALNNVLCSLLLPVLSQARDDRSQLERRYALVTQSLALLGGMIGIGFIVGGRACVDLVYGGRYTGAGIFIGWMGAAQALRLTRAAPTLTAIAMGDTVNAMVTNIVRALSLIGVLAVALVGGPLTWMAACALVAEALSLLVSLLRMKRKHGLATSIGLAPSLVVGAGMGVATLAHGLGVGREGLLSTLAACLLGFLALFAAFMLIFPELRNECVTLAAATRQFRTARVSP